MKPLIFVLALTVTCLSCKKDNKEAAQIKKENIGPSQAVEIYLFKSYQTVPGKCQIDGAVSVLQDTPIIYNQDILAYSPTDYQFKLTDTAIQKVKAFRDFTPFAVTVGKEVIYYGIFKPSFSNSSCDNSITMDIAWASPGKISLKLGYPAALRGVAIDDQRNNATLIAALKKQGKLK